MLLALVELCEFVLVCCVFLDAPELFALIRTLCAAVLLRLLLFESCLLAAVVSPSLLSDLVLHLLLLGGGPLLLAAVSLVADRCESFLVVLLSVSCFLFDVGKHGR